MIKKIAIGLVALVLLAAGVGAALPRTWRVEQSVVIAAPPERIFPFINDLKRWQEWSVFTHSMDPHLHNIYEGNQDGVGARWVWLGPQMGNGHMEITESSPTSGIALSESIETPSENARASLRFTRQADGTRVTWVDEGTMPFIVGGFFRGEVETQLGRHLAASLTKLKSLVEALPVPTSNAPVLVPSSPVVELDAGSL